MNIYGQKSGDFQANEVVTQAQTGASGTVVSQSSEYIQIRPTSAAAFATGSGRTISGQSNLVPRGQGVILAVNHLSWTDTYVLGASLPLSLKPTWLAKAELFANPIAGRLLRHLASIARERGIASFEADKVTISRSQVMLDAPIKTIGKHNIAIAVHPEVEVAVSVTVARSADEAERINRGEDISTRQEDQDAAAEALAAAGEFFDPEARHDDEPAETEK